MALYFLVEVINYSIKKRNWVHVTIYRLKKSQTERSGGLNNEVCFGQMALS